MPLQGVDDEVRNTEEEEQHVENVADVAVKHGLIQGRENIALLDPVGDRVADDLVDKAGDDEGKIGVEANLVSIHQQGENRGQEGQERSPQDERRQG
jgi:hypothetical protein